MFATSLSETKLNRGDEIAWKYMNREINDIHVNLQRPSVLKRYTNLNRRDIVWREQSDAQFCGFASGNIACFLRFSAWLSQLLLITYSILRKFLRRCLPP